MTEAQIEAAARELCRLRGIDLRDFMWDPQSPYALALAEVRAFAEVGTAIASVVGVETLPPKRRKSRTATTK